MSDLQKRIAALEAAWGDRGDYKAEARRILIDRHERMRALVLPAMNGLLTSLDMFNAKESKPKVEAILTHLTMIMDAEAEIANGRFL